MAETHFIKAWPPFFRAVQRGDKRFEVRKDDRAYQAGDTLVIQEFDQATSQYSGASVQVTVTFVLRGGEFGVEKGFVVMSLGEIDPPHTGRPLGEMLSGARR